MIRTLPALLLGAACVALPPGSAYSSDAVLIGGGYDVHGSQGQIELNVKWVQAVLNARGLSVTTYFTDGNATGPDVHYQLSPGDIDSAFEPLARVFGDWVMENRRYREHDITNVSGSTRRSELEPALRDIIAGSADKDLLLVYNGHGSQSPTSPDQVTLDLWDNTSVTANELHEWLKPRSAASRFVFTQCYSGGFHRLAYENPAAGLALSDVPRCGFTAESAYRLAEGCSASIDTDDYRDYTTYFFAALSGFERNGEIISHNPDIDEDGITSLREAHLFTLKEAFSTDLSRSTSEDYLTQWQPWYLRWLPAPRNLPNNEYARLFRELASRYDIELNATSARVIRQQLEATESSMHTLAEQQRALDEQALAIQYELQNQLSHNWPALLGPYTGAYQALASSGELVQVASAVQAIPNYRQLVDLQDQMTTMELALLEQERLATQYQKLLRLRHLALLQQQLSEYGNDVEQADYASLLACEEVPLTDE